MQFPLTPREKPPSPLNYMQPGSLCTYTVQLPPLLHVQHKQHGPLLDTVPPQEQGQAPEAGGGKGSLETLSRVTVRQELMGYILILWGLHVTCVPPAEQPYHGLQQTRFTINELSGYRMVEICTYAARKV